MEISTLTSELLGIGAGIFELLGLWLIGSKQKLGFVLCVCGNLFWITFSLITRSAFGLIIVCSAALILNVRAYSKWKREERD